MKNILKKRLERLMAKKTDLSSRAMASEDAAEIRSIGEQLKELNEEIKDINDEIANLEKEEDEKRSAQPAVPWRPQACCLRWRCGQSSAPGSS